MKSISLVLIFLAAFNLRVLAAEPPLSTWGSVPSGMTILPRGLGIQLVKPLVRFRAYGAKVFPSQIKQGKSIAAVVYNADLIRPNKAADFKDIFGTPWYILPKQGESGSGTCYYTLDGILRNLLVPPVNPPGMQVELGSLAITAIRLHSIRPDEAQSSIRMTYHFEVQSFRPLKAAAGVTMLTQFHKSFALNLTLGADVIDKLGSNGSLQSGQFALSPIRLEYDTFDVGNATYETVVSSAIGGSPYVQITGRDSTFDFADWDLSPSNGNLSTLIADWNRAWKNAADHVSGPTSAALLGHRGDINLPGNAIPFYPFFANGWDYVSNVNELPGKLAGVINREQRSAIDETLYFHAAPSVGQSNAGGRAWITIEDGASIEGSPGIYFRVTSSHAWPSNLEFDVVASSGNANLSEDLEYVPSEFRLYAGETERLLHVPVMNDTIREGTEKFSVRLVPRQIGTWMRREEAVGTILDNDPASSSRPPEITRQPKSTGGVVGQTVVLDVAALGVGLKYQWTKNGKLITGGTKPRLEVVLQSAADGGVFQVKVSNAYGSVTSASVRVAIENAFTVFPKLLSVPATGGTYQLQTGGQGSWQIWDWELSYWLAVSPRGGGAGQSIQLTVGPNYDSEPRTETITVGGNQVLVSQAGHLGWSWKHPLPGANHLRRVVRRTGQWLAVGSLGTILTSTDGVAWTRQSSGFSNTLYDACWTGTTWVVVGDSLVLTSPDGVVWTQRYIPVDIFARSVVWTGQKVLIQSSLAEYIESNDGLAWEQKRSVSEHFMTPRRVVKGPSGRWLAVGYSRIMTSASDAFDWKVAYQTGDYVEDVTWTGSQFVAVGRQGGIFTSPDGLSWTSRSSGTTEDLLGIHSGGGLIVACGENGTVLTSTNGISWTNRFGFSGRVIRSMQYDGSRWVGVGDFGCSVTSLNGISWTASPTSEPPKLYGAAWSGSIAVVTGESGRIMTSADVESWTTRSSGTSSVLRSVVWAGNKFCAVGDGGIVLTSTDGITWTARTSGTTDTLYAVAWTGGQLVAVGSNGRIITSPDGITWTPRTSNTSNALRAVVWTGSTVVTAGDGGVIRTSNSSVTTWTSRSSGTSSAILALAWNGSQVVGNPEGSGQIIYSSSSGASWSLGGYLGSQQDVIVASGGVFWALGFNGQVAATSAAAADWQNMYPLADTELCGGVSLGSRVLVVGSRSTILVQGSNPPASLRLSHYDLWVPAEGGEYDIAVTAHQMWGVMHQSSWLSGIPAMGSGNGIVRVTVQANPLSTMRMGSITIGTLTVGLRQEGRRTLTAGTFEGVVQMEMSGLWNGSRQNDTGHYRFTLTGSGAFTGQFQIGNSTHTLSGVLNTDGVGYAFIPATSTRPAFTLVIILSPDGDQIEMLMSDGRVIEGWNHEDWTTESLGVASRQTWHSTLNRCLLPPRNNLLLTGDGNGYLIAKISTSGRASLSGRLPDGAAFSQSTVVSKNGLVPLYARPYSSRRGLVVANLLYDSTGQTWSTDWSLGSPHGYWIRPPGLSGGRLPEGIEGTLQVQGSPYTAPTKGELVMPVRHIGGNLDVGFDWFEPETATLTESANLFIPLQSGLKTSVTISPQTGLVTGKILDPHTNRQVALYGLLDFGNSQIYGHYLSSSGIGSFGIAPTQVGYKDPSLLPRRTSLGQAPLPTVAIKSPATGSTISSTVQVLVTGTASSPRGVSQVLCQVFRPGYGNTASAPAPAAGNASWVYTIPVVPGDGGRFVVHAMAIDSFGNQSKLASSEFVIGLQSTLTVNLAGSGSVTTGFLGTSVREVGKLVTITAKPGPGQRFQGWSGDHVARAPTTTFLIKPSMTITAEFVPK